MSTPTSTTPSTPLTIPKISLHNFDSRVSEITTEILTAATTSGFFTLTNHSITPLEIHTMFLFSQSFFSLPDSIKSTVPFSHRNVGWEKNAQIRPSSKKGTPDRKESYQIQFGENMDGLWLPENVLPGFKEKAEGFMNKAQEVSEKLMRCLARGLGFEDEEFFVRAHDVRRRECQSVFRLLHYFEVEREMVRDGRAEKEGFLRAGAHVDWDFLTLLFQREGQAGLEVCPGRNVSTEFGVGNTWLEVQPVEGDIVCNIGDLLMSWSDDRFKSTFHRVKTPTDLEKDYFGERYSMAYFNQPCTDVEIQGPLKKYPMVTGKEFTQAAMNRNFAALKAKKEELEGAKGEGVVAAS